MRQSLIIIDNFYGNPFEVRKIALEAKYPKPAAHTYPGKNSESAYYTQEVHEKIKLLTGEPNIRPTKNSGCGYFRISLESDSHEQDIHIDPDSAWGGVLYLNLPHQLQEDSGTKFWRHKKLNIDRCPDSPEKGAQLGYTNYQEIYESLIYEDGNDRSKWEQWASAPMKYNRLVLFDPKLWHSHGSNFGTDINNGRLVQLFFLENE